MPNGFMHECRRIASAVLALLLVDAPAQFGDVPRTGTMIDRTPEHLSFLPDGKQTQALTLPLSEVKRLEVSQGRRHQAWGMGTAIGLIAGAAGGAYVGALASMEGDQYQAGGVLVGALIFGGLGFVTGMFLGGMNETERWEPVPLDAPGMR